MLTFKCWQLLFESYQRWPSWFFTCFCSSCVLLIFFAVAVWFVTVFVFFYSNCILPNLCIAMWFEFVVITVIVYTMIENRFPGLRIKGLIIILKNFNTLNFKTTRKYYLVLYNKKEEKEKWLHYHDTLSILMRERNTF